MEGRIQRQSDLRMVMYHRGPIPDPQFAILGETVYWDSNGFGRRSKRRLLSQFEIGKTVGCQCAVRLQQSNKAQPAHLNLSMLLPEMCNWCTVGQNRDSRPRHLDPGAQ